MKGVYVKWYDHGRDMLLAACDEELLGKELDGFTVSKRFYGGELVSEEEFGRRLGECTIANLAGQRVINIAKRKGVVREEGIRLFSGVPHAQAVRML